MDFGVLVQTNIVSGAVPIAFGVVAVLGLAAMAWPRATGRRARLRALLRLAIGAAVGALVALAIVWIMIDVFDALGVGLSCGSHLWVALAFAAVGLAVASLWGAGAARRVIAAFSVVIFVAVGALGVNADIGQYPTVGSVLGVSGIRPLDSKYLRPAAVRPSPQPLWSSWVAPARMPRLGVVGTVHIPAPVSGFRARTAYVYLPPAALVANPPALPVIQMLSGQPGSPANVFEAGHLHEIFDEFAATHGGLAPIIVVPDQLGQPQQNPMCSDASAGKSATYLTVDVPRWIRANLPVATGAASWAIAGWSQGGTCAIQLGAGHPGIFGNLIDISGEPLPTIGTIDHTIAQGFGGDKAAYEAARPLDILSAHQPYRDEVAVFGWGAGDPKFGVGLEAMAVAAARAGMRTATVISPGTAHDWATVRFVMSHGLDPVYSRFGIIGPTT